MSARLTTGQVATLLERVRTRGMEDEAGKLAGHLESLGTEAVLIDHLALSAAAQQRAAQVLERIEQPYRTSLELLARFVQVEERKMKLEEAQAKLAGEDRAAARETSREALHLRYQHIIVPVVSALAAYLLGAAGAG